MAEPASSNPTGPIVGGSLLLTLLLAAMFIKPWEGRVLKPYRDIVQVLTVCDGHTGSVQPRQYTDAECDRLFATDLGAALATVRDCYPASMTEYQAAALTSLAFRTGPGVPGARDGVCWLQSGRMPTIRTLANEGRWAEACAQFDQWTRAGTQHPLGLVRRAAAERKLCEGRL